MISILADAAEQHSTSGRSIFQSDLVAAWRGRPSRALELEASAGAALFRGDQGHFPPYAAGSLGFVTETDRSDGDRRLRMSVHGRLVPGTNVLVLLPTNTLRGEANLEVFEGRLRIDLGGSTGYAVQGADSGSRDVRLEARSTWALTRELSIAGGLRSAWRNRTPFVGWQEEVFVGLGWAAVGSL
jgi:hypothetical protein